jgi:hypothetical protein
VVRGAHRWLFIGVKPGPLVFSCAGAIRSLEHAIFKEFVIRLVA